MIKIQVGLQVKVGGIKFLVVELNDRSFFTFQVWFVFLEGCKGDVPI
jgi:hypothetical protein